nr:MAG: DNA pilot protein [Microvirus sp.]
MDPVTGGLIVGGAGALLGLAGTSSTNAANKEIAKMNIDMQKETNAKNEALMREQWGREDNAVQRRARDLAAAGMSPLLAAGSAASAGGIVSMTAPQSRQVVQKSSLEGAVSGLYQGMMAQQSMMDMLARQQQVLIAQGSLELQQREQLNRDLGSAQQRQLADIALKYEDKTKLSNLLKTEIANQADMYNLTESQRLKLRTTDQQDLQLKKLEQIVGKMEDTFKGLNFVGDLKSKIMQKGGN